MYLRPRVHFLSKPGRTVALFCPAEGLSYDIVAVLAELLVGINDCAPCLPMPIRTHSDADHHCRVARAVSAKHHAGYTAFLFRREK
ncbi:hypothetical protein JS561_02830 [Salmonella enterica subsp. enterica serovar Infantis]|nr:hypothetical protein JS561_02830 [Salmonella enterica subsp. enterica serovar Infantis]